PAEWPPATAFVLHMRSMKPAPNQAPASRPAHESLNEQGPPASDAKLEVARPYDDADLVRRVQRGAVASFRPLFTRYPRRAYDVASDVVTTQPDALDVMHEASINVHKHIGCFHGNSSFYTWPHRIVMNLATDPLRSKRKVTAFH